jgi:hypothetical protein
VVAVSTSLLVARPQAFRWLIGSPIAPDRPFVVGMLVAFGVAFVLSALHVDGNRRDADAGGGLVGPPPPACPPLDAKRVFVQFLVIALSCFLAVFILLPEINRREFARLRMLL